MKTSITFESNTEFDLGEAIQALDCEFDHEQEMGSLSLTSGFVEWHIEDADAPLVNVDFRQKKAAALLLMGFDLPQPMLEAANTMMHAARICPGLTTSDLMAAGTRKDRLVLARDIINELLGEI